MDSIIETIVQNISETEIAQTQVKLETVVNQPGNLSHLVMIAMDEMN